ncbi:MAG: nuclear transport factor 2 family protein [Opitutae bacterium]|nr:nuclear transport factor 2 family protein [Opitutae bacterium]
MNSPPPTPPPITGREPSADQTSPAGALAHFYRAFNGRDLALMTANWSESAAVAMSNPLGGVRRGWPAIREVYARIFSGPAVVEVEFFDYTVHGDGELCYAVGRERGHYRAAGTSLALAIRTSRIFRREAGLWRQVHHHGSIEDTALLAAYQAAVGGRPAVPAA